MITEIISTRSSSYLYELAIDISEEIGIEVSPETLGNTLRRFNITRKVLDQRAMEINQEKIDNYIAQVSTLDGRELVWLDECHFNNKSSNRRYGYSPRGTRAIDPQPFQRGKKYSFIGAISANGPVVSAIFPGSVNGDRLYMFLEDDLLPRIEPNWTLIMDNVSFHRSNRIRDLINDQNINLIFLPPYSPHLDPIELTFNKMKAICKQYRNDDIERQEVIARAWNSISEDDCKGFVQRCGVYNI